MRVSDSDDGTAGMDIFATLFAVFVLLLMVAVAIAGVTIVDEDDTYVIGRVYLEPDLKNANDDERVRASTLLRGFYIKSDEGHVVYSAVPSDSDVLGCTVWDSDDSVNVSAVCKKLRPGSWKVVWQYPYGQDSIQKLIDMGAVAGTKVCLDVQFPLQTAEAKGCEKVTLDMSAISVDINISVSTR